MNTRGKFSEPRSGYDGVPSDSFRAGGSGTGRARVEVEVTMATMESAYLLRQIAGKYFHPDEDREAEILINETEGADYVAGQNNAFDAVFHILHGLADKITEECNG